MSEKKILGPRGTLNHTRKEKPRRGGVLRENPGAGSDFRRHSARLMRSLRVMDQRAGRKVGFTIQQFRVWLDARISDGGGSARCLYCYQFLGLADVSIDHLDARARGGRTDLDNLAVCCLRCNRMKGRLGLTEYLELREMIKGWPDDMRADVERRLCQKPSFRSRRR